MPFLRYSRDKRGYEHFFLVQPINRRGRPQSRILYWFRTPPNVKVGRDPFDPEIRRALETENPDVAFDWDKLLATALPRGEPEPWRERRDAERSQRARERVAAQAETATRVDLEEPAEEGELAPTVIESAAGVEEQAAAATLVEAPVAVQEGIAARKRRRRRGRRRPHRGNGSATNPPSPPEGTGN